jgi:uncharacterized protein (TIGR03435 family)
MQAMSVNDFAKKLAVVPGRPVIDKAGIEEMFDFHMMLFADDSTAGMPVRGGRRMRCWMARLLSIFTAMQKQFGSKLEQGRGPGESFVIDQTSAKIFATAMRQSGMRPVSRNSSSASI